MPYAEFSPQGRPGEAADSLLAGVDAGQSWMERSQAMKIRQQQAEIAQEVAARNRADYEMLRPVMQAQRQAEIAKATDELAASVTMNNLLAEAKNTMPILRQDWANTYKISDQAKRLEVQEQLLGNARRFSSLKDVAPEINQWNEVWAQGQLAKRASDQITGRAEIEVLKKAADQQINQLKADHAVEVAKLKTGSAEKIATENNATKEAIAGGKEDAKKETEFRKENTKVIQAGVTASQSRAELEKAIELLNSVGTGKGANTKLAAQQLGTMMGMDFSGAADAEQLQTLFGAQVLAKVKMLAGAISDKEGARLEQYSASMGKTPEGNRRILLSTIAALKRAQDIAERTLAARKAGMSESEIAAEIQDYQLRNPITSIIDAGPSAEKRARLEELRAKAGN